MAKKNKVKSVEKMFRILEELAKNNSLNISKIANNLNYPISTTHRFLSSLLDLGYVRQDPQDGEYYLGVKILSLSRSVLNNLSLREIAYPFLKTLQNKTGETANLVILDSDEVCYIEKIESRATVRVFSLIGKRAPIHATGVGKVFLANMKKDEVLEIVQKNGLKKYTENTITNFDELLKELEKIKKNDYAFDLEECEKGAICIAAPVRNHIGKTIASMSISIPKSRFLENKIPMWIEILKECTNELSVALGNIEVDK